MDGVVMVKVNSLDETGAYVQLLEYNNIEGSVATRTDPYLSSFCHFLTRRHGSTRSTGFRFDSWIGEGIQICVICQPRLMMSDLDTIILICYIF